MFLLTPELSQAVRELGRREGATLFMTLLAAFQVLLCRCSGEHDFVVGTAIANRNRSETESLIGFFINMLALRSDLSGNPGFRQVLQRVREETLGAYEHQDLPFDLLVQEMGGGQLFRVAFGVQNAPAEMLSLPGVRLTPIEFENDLVRYELTLWMADSGESLSALWTYALGLFDEALIGRMHKLLEAVLHSVTANPDLRIEDLDLLPWAEIAGTETPRERPKLGRLRDVKPRAVQVRVTS
jgi:non-ribosomal peptide synthetase component F